jgi:putative ABC transport system substrate-binding protein
VNNRRKLGLGLGVSIVSPRFSAFAQTQHKTWRIGYLDGGSLRFMEEAGRHTALMQGLREKGYVNGKNVELLMRFAEGKAERLDALAAELVRQKVDLIITLGTPAVRASQKAISTTPIIVVTMADPVGNGFAASLARPGGFITGMSDGLVDTVKKLVEIMQSSVDKLKRVAVLSNPANVAHPQLVLQVQAAALQMGLQVVQVSARIPAEIELAFSTLKRERAEGLIILVDTFFLEQRKQIADLALTYRLPSIFPQRYYAEVGGLMSYGADLNDNFRRAGAFVDKMLKGAKPADIPFEQPMRYYFVINRRTADVLGIKFSGAVLARVDSVIE